MISQMGAVSGRRIKPRSVDIVNSQLAYLPAMYRRRQDKEYADKMYNLDLDSLRQSRELEEKRMAQNEAIARRNYKLSKAAQDEQESQAKKARRIGYANLGLQGALGLGKLYNTFKPDDAVSEVASTVMPSVAPEIGDAMTWATEDPSTYGIDYGSEMPGFETIKQIGGSLLDFGGSMYDEAVDFISGIFT